MSRKVLLVGSSLVIAFLLTQVLLLTLAWAMPERGPAAGPATVLSQAEVLVLSQAEVEAPILAQSPEVNDSAPATSTWSNAGLYGGRADHYLVEPVSGTIYANVGLTDNGLWVSTDHGATWEEFPVYAQLVGVDTVSQTVVGVWTDLLVVSPSDVVTIALGFGPCQPYAVGDGGVIYLGTHFPYQSEPLTLRRSTDGGHTWVTTTLPYTLNFTDTARTELIPDPGALTTNVYLSNQGGAPAEGVWRGVWNGADFDWTKIFTNTDIAHISANPHYTGTRQIWATVGTGKPWRIEDDGTSIVATTEITTFPENHGSRLAFHPASSTTVYIDQWMTTDNGGSWSPWNNPFSWGDFPIVFDETDPTYNTIWMGSNAGMWRTMDHGATWSQRSTGIEAVDVYDVEQNPVDVRVVYAATDGGLWRTLDFDAIAPTWELVDPLNVNIGVYNTVFNDPSDTGLAYAAREASSLWQTYYGDALTETMLGNYIASVLGEEVFLPGLAADPQVSETIYAAGYGFAGPAKNLIGGVFASDDGGGNWTRPAAHPAFAVRAVGGRLFAGIYNGSGYGLISTTLPLAGPPTTWAPVAPSVITTTVIAIDHYSNTLLIGAGIDESIKGAAGTRWQREDLDQEGQVYVSYDGGATWANVTPLPLSDPNYSGRPFRAVSVDPFDAQHLRVASAGAAYESFDGGASWSELGGELWASIFDIGYMAACPSSVTNLTGTVGSGVITLTWTPPSDYPGAIVRAATSTYPVLSTMGSLITDTVLTRTVYTGLGSGATYFGVFAHDELGHVGRSAQLMVQNGQITVTVSGLADLSSDRVRSVEQTAASRFMGVLANSGGVYRTEASSRERYSVYLPLVLR